MTKGLVTKIIGTMEGEPSVDPQQRVVLREAIFHRPDDLKNIPYTSSDVQDVRGQERPSLD